MSPIESRISAMARMGFTDGRLRELVGRLAG